MNGLGGDKIQPFGGRAASQRGSQETGRWGRMDVWQWDAEQCPSLNIIPSNAFKELYVLYSISHLKFCFHFCLRLRRSVLSAVMTVRKNTQTPSQSQRMFLKHGFLVAVVNKHNHESLRNQCLPMSLLSNASKCDGCVAWVINLSLSHGSGGTV